MIWFQELLRTHFGFFLFLWGHNIKKNIYLSKHIADITYSRSEFASYLLARWYFSHHFSLIVNGFTSFIQWCAAHNFQIFSMSYLLFGKNSYIGKWKIYNSWITWRRKKRMRFFMNYTFHNFHKTLIFKKIKA